MSKEIIELDVFDNIKSFYEEKGMSQEGFINALSDMTGLKIRNISSAVEGVLHINSGNRIDMGGQMRVSQKILRTSEISDWLALGNIDKYKEKKEDRFFTSFAGVESEWNDTKLLLQDRNKKTGMNSFEIVGYKRYSGELNVVSEYLDNEELKTFIEEKNLGDFPAAEETIEQSIKQ